jgi:hypothetical protein
MYYLYGIWNQKQSTNNSDTNSDTKDIIVLIWQAARQISDAKSKPDT